MPTLTFFQLIVMIAQRSGLTEAEIARRTNERSKTAEMALCPPIHRATVNRMLRGIDLPSAFTLYRIARFGLSQTEKQCKKLEEMRQQEKAMHTTSHHKAVKKEARHIYDIV